jgi:hypothetical protein
VVAECLEVGHVVVVDASGELRVVDGGERHRLRGVEDPPGDCDHLRRGVEPPQDGVELLAEPFEPADDVVVDDVRDEQVGLAAPVVVEDARIVEQALDGIAERDRAGPTARAGVRAPPTSATPS